MGVHPQAQAVLDLLNAAPTPLKDLPPPEARAAYDRFIVPRNFDPAEIGSVEDRMIPGPGGDMRIRIYTPEGADGPLPGFLFIHGGGFVIGSIESRDPQCRIICRDVGCVVISVDYRLAPEHPYPAAPDDCWAALLWTVENEAELGINASRIAVGGESAGGNLAAGLALRARETGGPTLVAQILVYPVTDMFFEQDLPSFALADEDYFLTREQMRWYWDCYLPGTTTTTDPLISPCMEQDLSNLPFTQIVTAEFDPLRDDGKRYGERLAAAGVDVEYACMPGMIHGYWHYGKLIDASAEALQMSVEALKRAFAENEQET
ncbi:MAG: alpha/beta hydrolase [Alphaproteobacteria bacterium]